VIPAHEEGGKAAAVPQVLYEKNGVSVRFSGFAYQGKDQETGDVLIVPRIAVKNGSDREIRLAIDPEGFTVNGIAAEVSEAREILLPAGRKISFPAAEVCFVNLTALMDRGETVIRNAEMKAELTVGGEKEQAVWTMECEIPADTLTDAFRSLSAYAAQNAKK